MTKPQLSTASYAENPSPELRSTKNSLVTTTTDIGGEEAVIAVMGVTGVGKTTFINLASGSSLDAWSNLNSCTNTVQISDVFQLDGKPVVLVDTPGFDDTTMNDFKVLQMIAGFLEVSYRKGSTLNGIIYMHRISDPRVGGVARRNFKMLRKLCGTQSLENVVIVTSWWDEVKPERGNTRERELSTNEDMFKPMLDANARMRRHNRTRADAHEILRLMLKNTPTAMKIQTEMVEAKKSLYVTEAGSELNGELVKEAAEFKRQIRELQKELEVAVETRVRDSLQSDIRKLRSDMDTKNEQFKNEMKAQQEAFARRVKEVEQTRRFCTIQ